MQTVYIETEIFNHPRTQQILARLGTNKQIIECQRYQEVFNPKAQNFRLQKQAPALILARKHKNHVLATPEGFGIGGQKNFYFSHMLNCLYDCRYCFLQGMYNSAHYVVFVNYEDFMQAIQENCQTETPSYFFSGYDGDSLAYEPVTHFLAEFLPFFKSIPNAILELRSKSTNIHELLRHDPFQHCVVAFSFTPKEISAAVEHKVPPLEKRLYALQQVAQHGWPIGLRFDPLIFHLQFKTIYQQLIETIFSYISPSQIHSVSIGTLRFPENMYKKIIKLYPHETLFFTEFEQQNKHFSYSVELQQAMKAWVVQALKPYISNELLFSCQVN